MNSWAKVIREGQKRGFEFWGFFNRMDVYKDGKYLGSFTSFKQIKSLILS